MKEGILLEDTDVIRAKTPLYPMGVLRSHLTHFEITEYLLLLTTFQI